VILGWPEVKAETCRQINKTNKNMLCCDFYKNPISSSIHVHNGDGTPENY